MTRRFQVGLTRSCRATFERGGFGLKRYALHISNTRTLEFVPYLSVHDAEKAVAYYSSVFEAEPSHLLKMPDGRIMHAEYAVGGARIFLSAELPEHGGTPSPKKLEATSVAIHFYVEDCDAMLARMERHGAEVLMPATNMFWGERFGRARDPFGHEWGIATRLRDMTTAEIQAAANAVLEGTSDAQRRTKTVVSA